MPAMAMLVSFSRFKESIEDLGKMETDGDF
jgi:hypothetical protein